ncbi:uncharacterized protein LOC128198168 [Bicyclus anynana]|uniref:Uncharacterized protein LOC128198168 n=1 Tax=Bicyclus anynana TaxID=110368 RepID=A0ABM3LG60_BICAN|nr:uncharacterized protein LOC128198168 [Bicyclus anynana]
MYTKVLALILPIYVASVEAFQIQENALAEARGKGKYALLIHFFYVVATKLFVLKIIYGVILYIIATKAWHFVLWLIHYLKEKEHHHDHQEVYVAYDHEPYHSHHSYHDHHDDHSSYVIDDDAYDHQPYGAYSSSYGRIDTRHTQKKVYDADGSYSVGG